MKLINENVGIYPDTDLFEVTEMTRSWYYHFQGCVPPLWINKTDLFNEIFMVGEADDHIYHHNRWIAVYRACIRVGSRYFSVLMPRNFDENEYRNVKNQIKETL